MTNYNLHLLNMNFGPKTTFHLTEGNYLHDY